ncbi:MAG: two-component system, OmpR family, phosphate regulon response regulator PhoB [Chthoniobacter sp.]|jgi:DNA-binding response OmpR family regulator|nr:two-component system, OmpR family, phosphate regulon response regulator PhoB [Chthoniobacter sp.]
MTLKRVLIIEEDRLLGNFYREHVENAGFIVETARSGDAGLKALSERRPDAVVIDPITPGLEAPRVVESIRGDAATRTLPIIGLPVARAPLAEAVHRAGASRVLSRTINSPAELVDAIQAALGRERTALLAKSLPLQPDPSWSRMCFAGAAETFQGLRHSLHGALRETGKSKPLRELLQGVHGFTEEMALFGERPLFQFAAALEALVYDLNRFPDQANASTLRTLGQAIDFFAVILSEEHRSRIEDPGTAQILVVDDEDGARKIVMAAMSLVNLRSISADCPNAALAALNTQPFDLIFLDVGMPEMNGFELCTRLRTVATHEKTPVVFLTGMATFQNRVQSSLSGANDLVGKPFSVSELGLKALIWVFKGQLGLLQ